MEPLVVLVAMVMQILVALQSELAVLQTVLQVLVMERDIAAVSQLMVVILTKAVLMQ
jgi:hypothetical protein